MRIPRQNDSTTSKPEVTLSTKGDVPMSARERAATKFGALAARCREPVRSIDIRLACERNPSLERPSIAEATIDLDGRPVRAHVAASRIDEAIDLAHDHLARRIARTEQRLHRLHERGATGTPTADHWRHGDRPTGRPDYFPRPVDERDLVRRKTFALDPCTIDEAAFDLDQLGHEFYLFTELSTMSDAVLSHGGHGGYDLICSDRVQPSVANSAVQVSLAPSPAQRMTLAEAKARLDLGDEAFVFFRDGETGRGNVLYRRYDGHYGLVCPADQA